MLPVLKPDLSQRLASFTFQLYFNVARWENNKCSFLPEAIPSVGRSGCSSNPWTSLYRVTSCQNPNLCKQAKKCKSVWLTDWGFTAELMCISSGLMQKITTPASHHRVSLASWLACAPCRSRSHRHACVYKADEKNPVTEEETCNFLSGCNYICFWVSVSYEHLSYELRLAAVSGASQTCLDITQSQRPDTNTLTPGTKKGQRKSGSFSEAMDQNRLLYASGVTCRCESERLKNETEHVPHHFGSYFRPTASVSLIYLLWCRVVHLFN